MPVIVCFEDGPASGQIKQYGYLSVPLPRLAWTGERGEVQAVYARRSEDPDADGVWHYRRVDGNG